MRRLRALVNGLPVDSATARHLVTQARATPSPTPCPKAAASAKVDYDALRKFGGEIITVPKRR